MSCVERLISDCDFSQKQDISWGRGHYLSMVLRDIRISISILSTVHRWSYDWRRLIRFTAILQNSLDDSLVNDMRPCPLFEHDVVEYINFFWTWGYIVFCNIISRYIILRNNILRKYYMITRYIILRGIILRYNVLRLMHYVI